MTVWRMLWHRYDDLRNYSNERSLVLAQLRDSIERPWQKWEAAQLPVEQYQTMSPEEVWVTSLADHVFSNFAEGPCVDCFVQ